MTKVSIFRQHIVSFIGLIGICVGAQDCSVLRKSKDD